MVPCMMTDTRSNRRHSFKPSFRYIWTYRNIMFIVYTVITHNSVFNNVILDFSSFHRNVPVDSCAFINDIVF